MRRCFSKSFRRKSESALRRSRPIRSASQPRMHSLFGVHNIPVLYQNFPVLPRRENGALVPIFTTKGRAPTFPKGQNGQISLFFSLLAGNCGWRRVRIALCGQPVSGVISASGASPQNSGGFCGEFGGYSLPEPSLDPERQQSQPEFLRSLPTTRLTLPFTRELRRRLANVKLGRAHAEIVKPFVEEETMSKLDFVYRSGARRG